MQKTAYGALLLTLALLLVCTFTFAQPVTLTGRNMSLKQVFSAIKKQTGYVVFYDQTILIGTKPVSLTINRMPLQDVLQLVLTDQSLNYIIQDKTIILSRKTTTEQPQQNIEIVISDPVLLINGVVRADNGDALPGASIRIKNTGTGTSTDAFGGFQLKRAVANSVIEISMIGYETVEFTVVKQDEKFQLVPKNKVTFTSDNNAPGSIYLTLNLKKSLSILDETQVIAYGRTSRRYATGSVGTVKAEDIQKQPVMNVLQALEGRVAGLVLTPNTGNSAAPVKVEIRGRNSLNPNALSEPLYVIDGVPQAALNVGALINQGLNAGPVQAGRTNTFGESPLLYLNPRDIESIDVLKDADATAIYGARGANGVILITTKKAKPGSTKFSMNVSRGQTTIPKKLDLMNTEQYLAVRREALRNDGIQPNMYNAPDLTIWDQNRHVDWQDYFFAPGEQLAMDAGVTGGIANTNYSLSGSYQSQVELMNQGGKTRRGTFAGNIVHTSLDQKFQFNFSSRIGITSSDAIAPGWYIHTPPNAPDVYNDKGEFNFVPYRGLHGSNFPFGELKRPSESNSNVINTNLRLSYEPVKGLTFSVNAGYNFSNNNNALYAPASSYDPAFGNLSSAIFGKSSTNNWLIEPEVQYRAFIGSKGNLSVQLGGSLQDVKNEGLSTVSMGFPNDNLIKSPNNAAFSQLMEGSGAYKYVAGFAILNFRWDNKYIANLSARRDGSSKFGPGKQFGNFGSAGLAWIASEEKWMRSILPSWFTFVKLRGSYGITGSDAVDDYEFLTRWGNSISPGSPTILYDYNGTPAFSLQSPVNQDFRWESTNKLDVAVNLGFLHDRINIEAGYYRKWSGNQLARVSTPDYTGFSTIRANWAAVVQNAGWEITLNGRIVDTKDWHLSANFNIGINKNKLVDYPGLETSAYADKYAIGQSLNLKYLFHYIGIDPATGDFLLEDRNKDGVVSFFSSEIPQTPQDDRYIVYNLDPTYVGGFGVQAGYKAFTLSGQFTFKKQLGVDPYYSLQIGKMQNVYLPQEIAANHWQKPGDIAIYPKYTTGVLNGSIVNSDRYYTDASYVKLGTLALSYDLPVKLLQKVHVQSCRFSINAQNLLMITSYRGIDPEMQSLGLGTPVTRTIAANLNFTF
jgi:TonB-dependent starch-binding outer membrane protein SusC